VLEEIDRFKRESSELGQNARTVSRTLDGLRTQGRLSEGVALDNGGRLRIVFQGKRENGSVLSLGDHQVDSRIVTLGLAVQKEEPGKPAIIVSKDINLRIKADALGLQAEDYETDRILLSELYTGMFEKQINPDKMTALRANGELEQRMGATPNEYCARPTRRIPAHRARPRRWHRTKLVPIMDARGYLGHQAAQSRTTLRF
jgi:PhoH-like ATPase